MAPTSSVTAAVGGGLLKGGAGPTREGFLCNPVSLCEVFGEGTRLTVIGESLLPIYLLSQRFRKLPAVSGLSLGLL